MEFSMNDVEDIANYLISRLSSLQNVINVERNYEMYHNSILYDKDELIQIEKRLKQYTNIIYDLLLIGLSQCPDPSYLTSILKIINTSEKDDECDTSIYYKVDSSLSMFI